MRLAERYIQHADVSKYLKINRILQKRKAPKAILFYLQGLNLYLLDKAYPQAHEKLLYAEKAGLINPLLTLTLANLTQSWQQIATARKYYYKTIQIDEFYSDFFLACSLLPPRPYLTLKKLPCAQHTAP